MFARLLPPDQSLDPALQATPFCRRWTQSASRQWPAGTGAAFRQVCVWVPDGRSGDQKCNFARRCREEVSVVSPSRRWRAQCGTQGLGDDCRCGGDSRRLARESAGGSACLALRSHPQVQPTLAACAMAGTAERKKGGKRGLSSQSKAARQSGWSHAEAWEANFAEQGKRRFSHGLTSRPLPPRTV